MVNTARALLRWIEWSHDADLPRGAAGVVRKAVGRPANLGWRDAGDLEIQGVAIRVGFSIPRAGMEKAAPDFSETASELQ